MKKKTYGSIAVQCSLLAGEFFVGRTDGWIYHIIVLRIDSRWVCVLVC